MLPFRKATLDHGKPWAMTQTALRSLLQSAAAQETSVAAIVKQWGESLDGAYTAEIHDGVAVIPVSGPLMRHHDFWSWLFGGSAYELLAKEISAAVANSNVRAVVLDVDSPGGEVTGCGELAELIFRMRGEKPIVAYATGSCASAAYWIASACDEVFVSSTSAVGSIGCVASIRDYSAAEEKFGVKEFEFVSSVSPAKRSDPATDEGAARIQAQVDALGSVFVAAVAKNRAVSTSTVLKDFGQGDVLVGAAAVEAGLADGIGTLEDVIAEFGNQAVETVETGETDMLVRGAKALTAKAKAKVSTKASARISAKAKAKAEDTEEELEDEEEIAEDEQDDTVAEEGDEDETAAEGDDEDVDAEDDDEDVDAEDEDEETAEDDEEEKPVAKASGERGRIAAILNSAHAKGRSALAKHLALNTGMSPKAAIGVLKASPKASAKASARKGNSFDAAMRAQGNPKVGTGKAATASADDEATARLVAAAKLIGRA